MTVLDRSELEASPLSDLHLIADQIGLESFRRLRKAELIDAILGEPGSARSSEDGAEAQDAETPTRTRRTRTRARRGRAAAEPEEGEKEQEPERSGGRRTRAGRGAKAAGESEEKAEPRAGRGARGREERQSVPEAAGGVVEILGNGSAMLRVSPPEPSEQDVYISAAQVRRCELVSGDEVSGPVRAPRRSERHPSLVRVETINGKPADAVAEGTRYEDLPAAWPSERIAFDSEDPTLKAIEWLTPVGHGSRAVIAGASRSGKSETLRRIAAALAGREGIELSLVLAGVRPEEIEEWRKGPVEPVAALSFAASADAQSQAVEGAVEAAKRLAARGERAVVLIDGLDGLQPHSARRVLAAARNVDGGGSLTVIATAARPLGGETTVICLDVAHTSTGRPPLDLLGSGTLRAELLVGDDGAQEIVRARAQAAA